jgi:hypothetical protein
VREPSAATRFAWAFSGSFAGDRKGFDAVTDVSGWTGSPAEAIGGLAVTPGAGDFTAFPGAAAVSEILAALPACFAAGRLTSDSFPFCMFPFAIGFHYVVSLKKIEYKSTPHQTEMR